MQLLGDISMCGATAEVFARPRPCLDKDAPFHRAIQRLGASHHNLSSVDFITNIAESNFRYTQSKSSKAKKKAPRQRG
jgi:hypothetical protein